MTDRQWYEALCPGCAQPELGSSEPVGGAAILDPKLR